MEKSSSPSIAEISPDEQLKLNLDYVTHQLTAASAPEVAKSWSKAFGRLLARFWGDTAGSFVEFMDKEDISEMKVTQALELGGGGPFRLGPGQITDDSEMAMSILHGLIPEDCPKFGDPQSTKKYDNGLPLDIAGI